MNGLVLLVDAVATNRIFLRSTLEAAHYNVICADGPSEAMARLAEAEPDLILLGLDDGLPAVLDFCRRMTRSGVIESLKTTFGLHQDGPRRPIPIIGMSCPDRPAARLAVLKAGATEVLDRPLGAGLLLARIRSILRSRDALDDFAPVEEYGHGFAEAEEEFHGPRRIIVLTARESVLKPALEAATVAMPDRVEFVSPGDELSDDAPIEPDLFVIDGVGARLGPGALLRLLSDLRSRPSGRHAAQLAILPAEVPDLAATALDLGANDVVSHMVSTAELAIRIRNVLRQKGQADRMRDRVRNGLRAAITDPLTGLYNRRYAMAQLARLAEQSAISGRRFATMVLDIDHFKSVNDRFGHSAGDKVLRGVAQILRDTAEPRGIVGRIGGEEFLIALPDTTEAEAQTLADTLRRSVAENPISVTRTVFGGDAERTEAIMRMNVTVTLSVGVALGGAEACSEAGIAGLYARADAALYAAKTAGRNTVTLSTSAA